ncbi:MAG: hypothetical protein ACLFR1_13085 [Spirochaetia bacterium]
MRGLVVILIIAFAVITLFQAFSAHRNDPAEDTANEIIVNIHR